MELMDTAGKRGKVGRKWSPTNVKSTADFKNLCSYISTIPNVFTIKHLQGNFIINIPRLLSIQPISYRRRTPVVTVLYITSCSLAPEIS